MMKELKDFSISFIGLKEGKHDFNYHIDNTFFKHFQYEEFLNANVTTDLLFEKKATLLELAFKVKGKVEVLCDVTNEPFNQPIENEFSMVVKFGDDYNNDNDEVLIIPHGEHQINVSQYIYEMIVLAVPAKRVHPGIEDGTLDSEMLKKLEEYSIDYEEVKTEETIDPRWNKLKDIVIDKKS